MTVIYLFGCVYVYLSVYLCTLCVQVSPEARKGLGTGVTSGGDVDAGNGPGISARVVCSL